MSLYKKIDMKPPIASVGPLGWIRRNLFDGWFNSLLTIVVLSVLWSVLPPLFRWLVTDAVCTGTAEDCRDASGACWAFITENYRFILFGFYPYESHWRPALAIVLFVAMLIYSRDMSRWRRALAALWVAVLGGIAVLMYGGVFGLARIQDNVWGGLPLTLLLSVVGILAAYPFGIVLALGRRSRLPVIRVVCVTYIEAIRGVPLISLLFMASVMFPLFLPEGITFNKLLRAQMAIILFAAAYLAEVIRGGLQSLPRGHAEAAAALGLGAFQSLRLIILPQALKTVIPPTVSIFISTFKDTSLVVVIALFDLLHTTKAALTNPDWMGFSTEGYLFIAAIYFVFCFSMSRYSVRLEHELHPEAQRTGMNR